MNSTNTQLRDPSGADIVSLLSMTAPQSVLEAYGIDSAAGAAAFIEALDGKTPRANFVRIETTAVAIFWSVRTHPARQQSSPLLSRLSIRPEVLAALVIVSQMEEQAATREERVHVDSRKAGIKGFKTAERKRILKRLATQLFDAFCGPWKDPAHAGRTLFRAVKAEGEKLGVRLTDSTGPTTVAKWIRNHIKGG